MFVIVDKIIQELDATKELEITIACMDKLRNKFFVNNGNL